MAALESPKSEIRLTTTDPKDFSESGGDHRKSVLASTALIVVLLSSTELKPILFGVAVSVPTLWLLLGVAHTYFFVMWRLTSNIESDQEKRFWNWRGLWKQAMTSGTAGFPGKTKAQLLLIRALPIWAFLIGTVGVAYGLLRHQGIV